MLPFTAVRSKLILPRAAAPANIAFVGAADGGNVTATSLTFNYTVGAGSNLLVVPLIGDFASGVDDISGVTYNGAALTLAAKRNPAEANQRWTYLYYKLGPSTGTHSLVITAGSSHFLAAGAADYSGVAALDTTTTNGTPTTVTTLTTSITTVANNSWVILCTEGFSSNAAPTAGTGSTRRAFEGSFGAWGLFDSNSAITPAGSYSMTTGYPTATTNGITHVLASFHP